MSKTRFLVLIEMSVKERLTTAFWCNSGTQGTGTQASKLKGAWNQFHSSHPTTPGRPGSKHSVVVYYFVIHCSLSVILSYLLFYDYLIACFKKNRLILKTISSQFGEMVQSVKCSLCDDMDLNSICLNLYRKAKEMVLACNPSTSTLTQENPCGLLAIHSSHSVNSSFMEEPCLQKWDEEQLWKTPTWSPPEHTPTPAHTNMCMQTHKPKLLLLFCLYYFSSKKLK